MLSTARIILQVRKRDVSARSFPRVGVGQDSGWMDGMIKEVKTKHLGRS
jgi:hypothetical protein